MDIWDRETKIVKEGTKELHTFQMQLTDRTTGRDIKRRVSIINGSIAEMPDDVDIIGDATPFGFIARGLQFKKDLHDMI